MPSHIIVQIGFVADGWHPVRCPSKADLVCAQFFKKDSEYVDYHCGGIYHTDEGYVFYERADNSKARAVCDSKGKPIPFRKRAEEYKIADEIFYYYWRRNQRVPLTPSETSMAGQIRYTKKAKRYAERLLTACLKWQHRSSKPLDPKPIRDFAAMRGLTLPNQISKIAT